MAIEIPDDWPAQSWAEVAPVAHLETIDKDAPDGTEPVRWKVSQWSSTREIKSASLPGQVRHQTGLSIGTGNALVKRQPDDFPWKQSLVYDLTGQSAQILLAPEHKTEIPTGQFRVADINGTLTTLGVQTELEERSIEGAEQAPAVLDFPWHGDISQEEINQLARDPIWLVAELAEQMGYTNGSAPIPGQGGYVPILDVPFHGSLVSRYRNDVRFFTTDTLAWGESEGVTGLTGASDNSIGIDYRVDQPVPQKFVFTMDADDGEIDVVWEDVGTFGRLGIRVEPIEGNSLLHLQIYSTGYNGSNNTITTHNALDITRNPDIPNRIQVEVTLTASSDFSWGSASIRLRRRDGFWFGPYVHAMPNGLNRQNDHSLVPKLFVSGGRTGFLANFSMVDGNTTSAQVQTDLLTTRGGSQGFIYLEPLGGTIISPWLDPSLSVWATMQAIVEAWQGALITDVYGDLKVLNRFTLTGVNDLQPEEIVDIGLRFEDLPWSMDYRDQADRLVVKYRPVVEQKADVGQSTLPIVYEFQDIIIAYPGANNAFFTLDYIYPTDLKLLPFNRKDVDNGVYHVWDAYRYNNGTGAHIAPGDDIGLRIDRVTSSTWKVYIDNRTASPFHMVDNTGTPWLKLRSSWWYDQTQEQVIERGATATDARNPIEIDLSNYVQNEEDANALADFIWSRVNRRSWKATTINAVPDYRLDLGDVIEIVHSRTGVRSNAIVTKIDLAGDQGSLTQKIDLTLIPSTWEDFDEAWANALPGDDWITFDALWAPYTWDDFDRTPTATTVAQIEEGM
jgi:hypothetical protein